MKDVSYRGSHFLLGPPEQSFKMDIGLDKIKMRQRRILALRTRLAQIKTKPHPMYLIHSIPVTCDYSAIKYPTCSVVTKLINCEECLTNALRKLDPS